MRSYHWRGGRAPAPRERLTEMRFLWSHLRTLYRRLWSSLFRAVHGAYMREAVRHHYCHGDPGRLEIGARVSTVNTLFNVASGRIIVGDDTIFGHNCMVLTGRHDFVKGRRKSLATGDPDTPASGSDIYIGKGCWIASGAIIVGPVKIGDNTIVAAGAVVTRDLPEGVFAAGVPAVVKKGVSAQ